MWIGKDGSDRIGPLPWPLPSPFHLSYSTIRWPCVGVSRPVYSESGGHRAAPGSRGGMFEAAPAHSLLSRQTQCWALASTG